MTTPSTISLDQAAQLLDFHGRAAQVSEQLAFEQLQGAAAAHNLLQTKGLAYIADEVGTGKTLIAAGALALLRHADPQMRALIIAPRANLQRNWAGQLELFAERNVTYRDMRVRGIDDRPVRRPAPIGRLRELPELLIREPVCDPIMRLSAFELAMRSQAGLTEQRDLWRSWLGLSKGDVAWDMLDEAARPIPSPANVVKFKRTVAACVNRLLPAIGVLVVDETHNLKGGLSGSAARNRVLHSFLGIDEPEFGELPGYGRRAERVLMLSATPMETEVGQVIRQLQVLGVDGSLEGPPDPGNQEFDDRQVLSQFLFRRLRKIDVAGHLLTRNVYRQQWEAGGVVEPDAPLELRDDRARLTLALVQKRVAEAVQSGSGGARFQIGMLTSFESLAESTHTVVAGKAVQPDGDELTFDDAEQNRRADKDERRGVDSDGIRDLVRSHQSTFGRPPSHVKMDAVVRRLIEGAREGRKALVFTRRVASVDEIVQAVDDGLDELLRERVRVELDAHRADIEALLRVYADYRSGVAAPESEDAEGGPDAPEFEDDPSTLDERVAPALQTRGGQSFFTWLFRSSGESQSEYYIGTRLRERLEVSGAYATLLQENYVAAALGCSPADVQNRLEALVTGDVRARDWVNRRATRYLPAAARPTPRAQFLAAQYAGLQALEEFDSGAAGRRARDALTVLAPAQQPGTREPSRTSWEQLSGDTLATRLSSQPELLAELWPQAASGDWADADEFRRRQWAWRLLSAAIRLDYPSIDLWLSEIDRAGSLRIASSKPDQVGLIDAFVKRLAAQRADTDARDWSAYRALRAVGSSADLIREVNRADFEATSWVGDRYPAAGMSGKVNETVVRQFRTATYPLVLVTTDLLQEGEDLHTFCDEVHHYGIAWMPSALEQRIGRVDRVSSLTERRLRAAGAVLGADGRPPADQRLNVLFPHVAATYEAVQVNRVLDRLDVHIRLLHESFGGGERTPTVTVDFSDGRSRSTGEVSTNLAEPFVIQPTWLPEKRMATKFPVVERDAAAAILNQLKLIRERLTSIGGFPMTWDAAPTQPHHLLGQWNNCQRVQPIDLRATSWNGRPALRMTSPVGYLTRAAALGQVSHALATSHRIGVVASSTDERNEAASISFSITIEDLIPMRDEAGWLSRLEGRLEILVQAADALELELLDQDQPLEVFRDDLADEVHRG